MTIVLNYTTEDGSQEQVEFEDDVAKIDLSRKRIASIDLTPLSSCTSLQNLFLGGNQLTSLDLTPLATCINLRVLDLGSNQLQSVDLTPLNSCSNLQQLHLGFNQLKTIDLTPLSSCQNLQILYLRGNQFQTIDLTPISSCINLSYLHLDENNLQNIDLAPISSCANLQKLDLRGNQLLSIDLSPLSSCVNLQELALNHVIDIENNWQKIDLGPLSSCVNLRELVVGSDKTVSIDISPLSSCSKLSILRLGGGPDNFIDLLPLNSCEEFIGIEFYGDHALVDITPISLRRIGIRGKYNRRDLSCVSWIPPYIDVVDKDLQKLLLESDQYVHILYRRPLRQYPWSFLYKVIEKEHFQHNFRVQHDMCQALGLGTYGFVDYDLTDTFLSVSPETSTNEAQEKVANALVEAIAASVDRDGPTTGLDIENLFSKHGEIVSRTQRIIELRNKELERVTVSMNEREVDLKELWLTAYGYRVLMALGMSLTTDSEGLKKITGAFDTLGYELKIDESSKPGVNMSDEMKESIWWIVRNRENYWNYILGNQHPI